MILYYPFMFGLSSPPIREISVGSKVKYGGIKVSPGRTGLDDINPINPQSSVTVSPQPLMLPGAPIPASERLCLRWERWGLGIRRWRRRCVSGIDIRVEKRLSVCRVLVDLIWGAARPDAWVRGRLLVHEYCPS